MCSHVCGQAVLSMHVEEKDLVFRRTRCPWSINQNPVNNVWRWAGSGRVRPIINIHYLSRPRLKQAWMYIHINRQTLCRQASGNEEWHQCENEINRPSLSFVMKCLSCSFIWWSAQPNQTSNSAGVGGGGSVGDTVVWLWTANQSFTQVWLTLGRKDLKQKGQELVFVVQFGKDGADGWERSDRNEGLKPEKTKWAVAEHSRWFTLLAWQSATLFLTSKQAGRGTLKKQIKIKK